MPKTGPVARISVIWLWVRGEEKLIMGRVQFIPATGPG